MAIIFNTADVVLVTKMDLAQAADFDLEAAPSNIQRVRPGMQILEVSAKNAQRMDEAMKLVESSIRTLQPA